MNNSNYNNCPRYSSFLLNDECILNCTIIERQKEQCVINYFNNTDKEFNSFDIIIKQIRYELTNNFDNSVVNNKTIKEKDFKITITKSDNQEGIIINLSQCEEELKIIYDINKNESSYLLKYDIEQDGMYSSLIGYELYYLNNDSNLKQLNLSLCEGIKVNITIPTNITGNIDKYNISRGYYKDICYTADSEYKTDIILEDRINEDVNNNMSICEKDCDFIAYNSETQKAVCSCGIKTEIPLMKNIKFDKKVLFNSFTNINNLANTKILKCYKTVFNHNSIINNTGFFIFAFCILIDTTLIFSFYLGYYNKLIENINEFKTNILNRNKNNKINNNEMISSIRKNKNNRKNIIKNNNSIKLNNNNVINKKNFIHKKKKKISKKINRIINSNINKKPLSQSSKINLNIDKKIKILI